MSLAHLAGPTRGEASGAASSSVNFDEEWQSPSPPAGQHAPDTKEYWKAKYELSSSRGKELFAAGKALHDKPLTLKASHPAWQVKMAAPVETDPTGRQRLKSQWGDMDACEMLEAFEEQDDKDEKHREAIQQRREEREENKRQKLQLEEGKRELQATAREMERPVTDLLKSLGFVASQNDEASAPEISLFARTNRQVLNSLGVDLASLTKKAVMPQLLTKNISAAKVTWSKAPPKALPAPKDAPATAAAATPAPTVAIDTAALPEAVPYDADPEQPPQRSRRERKPRDAGC